jgi:hypothetical protein
MYVKTHGDARDVWLSMMKYGWYKECGRNVVRLKYYERKLSLVQLRMC